MKFKNALGGAYALNISSGWLIKLAKAIKEWVLFFYSLYQIYGRLAIFLCKPVCWANSYLRSFWQYSSIDSLQNYYTIYFLPYTRYVTKNSISMSETKYVPMQIYIYTFNIIIIFDMFIIILLQMNFLHTNNLVAIFSSLQINDDCTLFLFNKTVNGFNSKIEKNVCFICR